MKPILLTLLTALILSGCANDPRDLNQYSKYQCHSPYKVGVLGRNDMMNRFHQRCMGR